MSSSTNAAIWLGWCVKLGTSDQPVSTPIGSIISSVRATSGAPGARAQPAASPSRWTAPNGPGTAVDGVVDALLQPARTARQTDRARWDSMRRASPDRSRHSVTVRQQRELAPQGQLASAGAGGPEA